MTELTTIQAGRLEFRLQFDSAMPEGTAATATRGWLGAWLDATEVWTFGGPGTPTWPWIELLEHLAAAWPSLLLEAGGDPLALGGDPDTLLDRAATTWANRGANLTRIEREDGLLRRYIQTHDLSAAFRGAAAPSLYVVRVGERARLVGGGVRGYSTWADVEHGLEALGDSLAARLTDLDDGRASDALRAWGDRANVKRTTMFAMAVAWPADQARRLLARVSKPTFGERPVVPTPDELASHPVAIAARMLRPDDATEAARLLRPLARAGKRAAPDLDALRADAVQVDVDGPPFQQGYTLALWLRDRLGNLDARFDVEATIADYNIEVIEVTGPASVDALCAYGPRHGPLIVLNTHGTHSKRRRGRRATLAHELCHLMVDLGVTLPIAEAKAPRAPAWIEQRANAFAAELLIPRTVAGEQLRDCRTSKHTQKAVDALCRRYTASRAIVAWQGLNSEVDLRPIVRRTLTPMAPFARLRSLRP